MTLAFPDIRLGRLLALALRTAIALGILAPAAGAASTAVSGTVAGGALSVAVTGGSTRGVTSRAGATRFSVPVILTDARGTGGGWRLVVASEAGGIGSPIEAVGAAVDCVGGTCTAPRNDLAYPIAVAPTGADSVSTVFAAQRGTGLGRFRITPTFATPRASDVALSFAVVAGP